MTEPVARPRYKGPLTITDIADEAPVAAAGPDLSQFTEVLRHSQEKKAQGHEAPAVGMTIPTAALTTIQNRFKAAAKSIGCGVTFSTHSDNGQTVRLIVEARDRKNTGPKGSRKEATAEANGKPSEAVAQNVVTAPVKGRGLPKVTR